MEDLDPDRSRPEHEEQQRADLLALGLDWDREAPRQSSRGEAYRHALHALRDAGRVYPCWCSRAEIRAAAQAPHGELPEGAYPGTCRGLSPAQQAARAHETGREPALRLDARAERVAVEDRLHGRIEEVVDDFVLWRADDTAAYNLAVVVDDAEQGVEEVVRGDDLLDTTPRQVLLQRLLGYSTPSYAHVPLVLGQDGRRLAKRDGDVTLGEVDPPDALAWIAVSLGLARKGERPTAGELVGRFSPDDVPPEPITFIRRS